MKVHEILKEGPYWIKSDAGSGNIPSISINGLNHDYKNLATKGEEYQIWSNTKADQIVLGLPSKKDKDRFEVFGQLDLKPAPLVDIK